MFKIEELTGVLPALVSPLRRDGSVDEAAVPRLVQHMLDGGVHGLLALGSTGETASLDETSRRKVLDAVVRAAGGRVPVLCGVAQSHLAAARVELAAAANLGADAALVAPPFYYPMDQPGVLAFFRELAAHSPLPILLYHIPQFTKVMTEPASVAALAREGTIAGIKDSSRDFEYFEGVCIATRDLPGFRIFTGSDTMLLPSLAMGGAGTICGAANVAPHWVVRIYDEYRRGDLAAARKSQDALYQLVVAVRAGVFPGAIKAALELQGICEPWLAPPVRELDEVLKARLREQLAGWNLLEAAAPDSVRS
ncbi:MAG TPA: dihydrodipicolinate synthase family protein [Candidatus Baltobacterales bacterium]|nr:dihydrodipicolinate synthase family protein [Candidatus Baltobacterales bacterium]